MNKIKIIFIQLGTPKSTQIMDIWRFLRWFLANKRVIDVNPIIWKLLLNLVILPSYIRKSAKAYRQVWDGSKFLLTQNTDFFVNRARQTGDQLEIDIQSVYLNDNNCFAQLWFDSKDLKKHWFLVPLFPQYSEATTALAMDLFYQTVKSKVTIPSFSFISSFHNVAAYIENSASRINQHLKLLKDRGDKVDILICSFHGLPQKRINIKGDPYLNQCRQSFNLIAEKIKYLESHNVYMTFQSRFGKGEWLQPYTREFVFEAIRAGKKKIAICCPGFLVDCTETKLEIAQQLANDARTIGGKIFYIPCLNDDERWCKEFTVFLNSNARTILT